MNTKKINATRSEQVDCLINGTWIDGTPVQWFYLPRHTTKAIYDGISRASYRGTVDIFYAHYWCKNGIFLDMPIPSELIASATAEGLPAPEFTRADNKIELEIKRFLA